MRSIRRLFFDPTSNGTLQFLRYVGVGGIAFLGDWIFLYIIVMMGMHYLLAGVFSFIIGLTINYYLSKAIVFQSEIPKTNPLMEFLLYGLIGVVGLGMTELILYFCTDGLNIYFMISKAIAAVIVLVWNFGARKCLLYKGVKA